MADHDDPQHILDEDGFNETKARAEINELLAKLEHVEPPLTNSAWRVITERLEQMTRHGDYGFTLARMFLKWCARFPDQVGRSDAGRRRHCHCTNGWLLTGDHGSPDAERCPRCHPQPSLNVA